MIAILIISVKLASPGLLKTKAFWKKGYDVKISIHDVTNKISSSFSNYIVDAAKRIKFGNSSISMRKDIKTSIL